MKIGIVGAGAIGGWLAVGLAAAGNEVAVLARGASLQAIRTNGLTLLHAGSTQNQRVTVSDQAAALGEQDVVIIAVKAQSLAAVANDVAGMIAAKTIVVPLQNGVPWWFLGRSGRLLSVDPQGLIEKHIPFGCLVGCVVHAAASLAAPAVINLKMADRLIIGEPQGGPSPRLTQLAVVLAAAGCDVIQSNRIQLDIWYKLWGNMTLNPVSALTLANTTQILSDDLLLRFMQQVMAEAQAIGTQIGCPMTQTSEERFALTRKLGAFKTSMLQDLEAGREIELDALLAAPREIAARVGVSTPTIDMLFALTRAMGRCRAIYRG